MTALSLYNQDQGDDAAFVENFVARTQTLALIVNGLRHVADGGETEHKILIGMRGMGKTTLLRRVALAIGSDNRLSAVFVPLRFREEQYNVISLDTFWRNCGEALAEWCEANGHDGMAARIDRAVETPDWRDAGKAVAALLGFCAELGRRPCLLVDNLDLILDNLTKEGWALRNVLQREDGPVVIGAATQFLRQAGDRQAAFYEFFHPILLEPLTRDEIMHCMSALAERRGAAGRPVKDVLAQAPERILTLYTLTGGNPRVLALIYRLLEQAESEGILDDLQALLDEVTPFYKARVEEFQAAQQRAIIDAIALHWDPITSGALSEVTGIPVTTISSQLNRLRQTGFVQQVETSGSYAGYQLSERFLNIWYLMRHGTRRAKQRLRWLTIFLTRLFSEEELGRMAARAEAGGVHADFRMSVREAYGEIRASKLSIETARLTAKLGDIEVTVGDERALDREDAAVADVAEMYERAIAMAKAGQMEKAAALWDALVDHFDDAEKPQLQAYAAKASLDKGMMLGRLAGPDEAIAAFDEVITRFGTSGLPSIQEHVASAWLGKGINLSRLKRFQESIDVLSAFISAFDTKQLPIRMLMAQAYQVSSVCLFALDRLEEALLSLDTAIAKFGNDYPVALEQNVVVAGHYKAHLLTQLRRPEEALAHYDTMVTRFQTSDGLVSQEAVSLAFLSKGLALVQLARFEEAMTAFDKLIERCGGSVQEDFLLYAARGLGAKGRLLIDRWGRYDEAEDCYRRALAIRSDKSDSANLIWAMIAQGRWDDAQAARDALVDIPPEGLALMDAGIELVRDNLGNAFVHLGAALDVGLQEGGTPYFEDIIWLLRIGVDRGHGERLAGWFVETGHSERYAPVYAALVAYVRGERFLRDLNPEVRGVAERLYDTMAAPRRYRQSAQR